jgi:rfaE bifunctional protein, domain II
LKIFSKIAREDGRKIVMTNGCFDILHAGHIKYLEEAKALGDTLIIAINDDESVVRLKGKHRPINPLSDRMKVLDGLASSDFIVPFEEDTPIELINLIKPDILVKGGDYSINDVVGADEVREYGGDVKILSYLDDYSSSKIIEKLKI